MTFHMTYHLMIDRFAGGSNKRRGICFKGGNLHALVERLSYIKSLGARGIMLTPFYESKGYHGYHIVDYDKVDPHFGDWDDVQALIEAAHSLELSVTADFVANHCHATNSIVREHPNWFLRDVNKWHGFAGLGYLPMFDTDNQEVRNFLIERMLKLCEFGFNSFRLDHATGPSYDFWEQARKVIKEQYPNVKLIGEVWGELNFKPRTKSYTDNVKKYSPQEALQLEYVGVLDGVLDFEYHDILCKAAHKAFKSSFFIPDLSQSVEEHFARYPKNFDLWLMLDNHDLNRFLFECGRNKKLLREALQFTKDLNRPFLYYYGTETGLYNKKNIFGGQPFSDEQVRKVMRWNKQIIHF